ncbi:MAG: hypothetical protein KAW52_00635 [candidate division Zixibacteria bacterium]|nr:hypothetical protein [candidate division Zixibacteria bacterium]
MEAKKLFGEKILWVLILILLSLVGSCTTKETTGPVQPTVYLMKDYFPLNERDEWIWEVAIIEDSTAEPFLDGDVNLGEPFIDVNENGVYDEGIDYFDYTMDLNENGKYDGPNDPWTPGVPYDDRNLNGEYDPPNGKWDEGELFADLDGNGIWNWILNFHTGQLKAGIDTATSMSPGGSIISTRRSRFLETGENSVDSYTDDGFSNDSLGLRWHYHTDYWSFFQEDDLKDHTPIIIAKAETIVGDSVVNVDTSYVQDEISGIYTWISMLEAVEDVNVPAGDFQDCLKFKTVASGWEGNMARYNGTSYQWYAENVGLVKSEGPNIGEYWRLESATIKGTSYP